MTQNTQEPKPKVKVATVWLAGCSGCHMSFLDLDENLVELSKWIEITSSPITDVKEPPEVDVGLVEGAVANSHNEHVLKELRARSKILIALGDCACFGGVTAMRNMVEKDEALRRGYIETESTVDGAIPNDPTLPVLNDKVRPISEFVQVDLHVPGCPPPAAVIGFAIKELLAGRTPKLSHDQIHFD